MGLPLSCRMLSPRRGEVMIDSINSVEDTKGNNGERGSLAITNLRIIWQSHRHSRTNLSVWGNRANIAFGDGEVGYESNLPFVQALDTQPFKIFQFDQPNPSCEVWPRRSTL
jgi:hypothetical protein